MGNRCPKYVYEIVVKVNRKLFEGSNMPLNVPTVRNTSEHQYIFVPYMKVLLSAVSYVYNEI